MLTFLRTFGWLVSIVYGTIPCFWLAIHPLANFWRRRNAVYQILVPAWIALWIAIYFFTASWHRVFLYDAPWILSWLPAVALFAVGICLYRLSGRGFSLAQLGGLPELTDELPNQQRLVVTGIRQRVRHPIYAAHLCELAAWSVGTRLAVIYGLLLFALLTGAVMIWLEERELIARFGDEYRAYQQRVPMLIPRLWG